MGTDAGLVEEGAWRHLVVTQDGSAPHVFLDGSEVPLQGTSTGAWTGHLQSPGAWFGNSHWSPHVGGLDELRIYDRALSSGEVAAHYAGTFDDDSGLLGHWSFDEETDIEAGAFLTEHYASSFSPRDSLELMQFLPGFVEPGG
ncbi:MAG TPA: LamG-like jellyroll fold domain-containing protein [Myxococcota bacterium]|nr:LamG-like jellyroll fold domain-containing protein [Myxococcota bacterium]